jgi:hypothetical protein
MKKTFQLAIEGKNRDRLLEATKHEIRKYMQRERRKALPPDTDFWDFDCRFGTSAESAAAIHPAEITEHINQAAASGATAFYLELLAKPAVRQARATPADRLTSEHQPEHLHDASVQAAVVQT